MSLLLLFGGPTTLPPYVPPPPTGDAYARGDAGIQSLGGRARSGGLGGRTVLRLLWLSLLSALASGS